MSKYTETTYDLITGQTTIRDFTEEETTARNLFIAENEKKLKDNKAAAAQAATDKAALLAKLGITADEAKLLLS